MSAFAGMLSFSKQPVDRGMLTAFANLLAIHNPDGGDEVLTDSVGMIYRAYHTNRHSCNEIQPFISDSGTMICWDGRLDNRKELLHHCHLYDEELTDVQIVSACYERRGSRFLKSLVGDFALALWDAAQRTLILARDATGPRPLYYSLKRNSLIWCSSLSVLANSTNISLEVSDEYVAGHLTRGVEPHLTPYKRIHAVPPGHMVLCKDGKVCTQRFWSLDPDVAIRYSTEKAYEEHFLELFREAVRCRLRVKGPVWAQLSGGLDSSAIVCVADEILQGGEAEASKLETISYVYDEATSSDESEFIGSVERKRGRAGYQLSDHAYPALTSFSTDSLISFPDFLDCFLDRHRAMCEAMRRDGARVLLTGHGGDEMLGGNPAPGFGDMLLTGRFVGLHRSLREWSKVLRKSYGTLLWHDTIKPVLPRRLQLSLGGKPNWKLPPWFNEGFIDRMNLRDRYVGLRDIFGFTTLGARDQAIGLLSIIRFVAKASYRDRGAIEVSHPYLHRPLIEFLQAMPFEQRVMPGPTKSLLRRSLSGSLPEQVLNRKSKRGPDEALMRAIARQWSKLESIFTDARVCAYGYVDRRLLIRALERARHGIEPYSFALIQTISLELWLRSLEIPRSSSTNPAILDAPLISVATMETIKACAQAK